VPLTITPGDLSDQRVIALLATHVAAARAQTAPGSAHALDLDGLQAPHVSCWTAWDGEALLGTGALARIADGHGEIKSMDTAEAARRRGVGSAILLHLIAVARDQGMTRLSLETGSWPYFEPARALYRRHGFVECGPFGEYRPDPNSVFMALAVAWTPAAVLAPPKPIATRPSGAATHTAKRQAQNHHRGQRRRLWDDRREVDAVD